MPPSNASHGLFDEALAEGAGVGEVDFPLNSSHLISLFRKDLTGQPGETRLANPSRQFYFEAHL